MRHKNRLILGIDPGYGCIGYGLIWQEKNKTQHIGHGCIRTKNGTPFETRLMEIFEAITELIKKTKPDVLSIEKLFFYKNVTTAIDVGQARGVIILAARLQNIPIVEFTPLQVKQAVTGYGQAQKGQIQKMVALILNLTKKPTSDDAADALAIAICASQTNLTIN